MGDRDWPARRHGGPERIRGPVQQVERSLSSPFLPRRLFLFSSRSKAHEATTIVKCGCICRADYHAAAAAAATFLTSLLSVGGQPGGIRSIDTTENNGGWGDRDTLARNRGALGRDCSREYL